MNKKIWAAMCVLCLLGVLAGCSKKENTNEEQGTSPSSEVKPAPASAPIDPANRGQREWHCDLCRRRR